MTDMPKLTIGYNSYGYALAGWDEFNRFARMNWPLWRQGLEDASYMTETDRLRVMLGAYAIELERVKKEHADYVRENPPATMTGPNGEVYRYVGP